MDLILGPVTPDHWREALSLTVHPDHLRFVADHEPIAAIGLAKAYLRLGGFTCIPYAIAMRNEMVGFFVLAHRPGPQPEWWLFHFFIDRRHQRRGYDRAALRRIFELVQREHPDCDRLQLVVHPENLPAQKLYTASGFRPTGEVRFGEPVYAAALKPAAP